MVLLLCLCKNLRFDSPLRKYWLDQRNENFQPKGPSQREYSFAFRLRGICMTRSLRMIEFSVRDSSLDFPKRSKAVWYFSAESVGDCKRLWTCWRQYSANSAQGQGVLLPRIWSQRQSDEISRFIIIIRRFILSSRRRLSELCPPWIDASRPSSFLALSNWIPRIDK